MSNNEKNSNNVIKKSSRGFYLALTLCLVAIAVAAWFTYGNTSTTNSTSNTSQSSQITEVPTEPADTTVSGVTESASDDTSSTDSINDSSSAKNTDAEVAEDSTSQTFFPAGHDVIKEFSGDNPVYSITLNDWRVHTGTDFAVPAGSIVHCMSDGVVKDIYNDDMYGNTVVIDHNNGYTAYYCGLGDNVLVNVGDGVSGNQEIGSIKSVPCECLEEDHLHLMVKENDVFVDPMVILQTAE